jgi:hypothetical protein
MFFVTYPRRELRRRMRQAIFIALARRREWGWRSPWPPPRPG